MEAIARPVTEEGKTIEDFKWDYGVNEYKLTFSKTCEKTACGPSGLHMSHWKAALERPRLMRVHSFYIWAAFSLGFSYPRWEKSWHCMLKKKTHPHVHKLRIIQLFEGDFNGALKYLLGRKLMQHATENGVIDNQTFGSRLGKSAIEAVINLQLIFDNHRIWKRNLAMLFNDADGCYDRIPPNLAEIAIRRLGCPSMISRAHTITQRKMKHYVKTSYGISKGFIQFNPEKQEPTEQTKEDGTIIYAIIMILAGPIGGVGQGGGASPIIWLAILLLMLIVYKQHHKGVEIIDRITKLKVLTWIISYVDDNTIVRSFDNNSTVPDILLEMKRCILTWNKLLKLTGGDLSLDKCKISIMHWKRNYWGIHQLSTFADNNMTIDISHESGQNKDTLERIEPWNAERVLGLRLPMTGNMATEFAFRKKQIKTLGNRIYKAPFTPHDVYVVYQSRYMAMVRYFSLLQHSPKKN